MASIHSLSGCDVFLSFISIHTSFTSDLCTALRNARLYVFRGDDDEHLGNGDQISTSVLQAIKTSRISIIVFSKDCASSIRCLQELEKIMECHKTMEKQVLPVFYDVDPFEVRDLSGAFGEAFENFVKRISVKETKVSSWRTALREFGALEGRFHLNGSRSENGAIDEIVEEVFHLLDKTDLFVSDYPIGVESRLRDVIQLLNNQQQSNNVLLLGIRGMVGSGKTTLAKTIFNQIGRNFQARSFLQNIREVWKRGTNEVIYLQERLLFDICRTTKIKISNSETGKITLKRKLCHKKVLIVLDDVNEMEQLNALCGSYEWFGSGSRIIITTRDERLLRVHGIANEQVYSMKEMEESESVELFSWHAFKQDRLAEYFAKHARKVLDYCGRLPLALVVLGSELHGKEITSWDNVLNGLKNHPHPFIHNKLKISFDDLQDDEKEIFFEIASFFVGMDQNDVKHTLVGFGLFPQSGISVLLERSFVTIDQMGKLEMHVLLREMGREIIREGSQKKLGSGVFDVFLSFRGADTRALFTSHLHSSLTTAGIYVLMDEDEHLRGERITTWLPQAIKGSRISIIVFSKNYANSRWCMYEVEKIMKHNKTTGSVVLPVFYDVDPSEVRHQTGIFGGGFEDLLKTISVEKDQEMSWRTALYDAGSIAGTVVMDSRNENEAIKKLVGHVTHLLDRTKLFVTAYPVGVECRVKDVIQELKMLRSKDVLRLGIWGMGGIGKTTITKAIYNEISHDFDGRSFLLNVREVWEHDNGQAYLQQRLLSDIYKTTTITIRNIESGKNELKDRLSQKKVLIVLDDVNKKEQLDALCGSHEWFGAGSRIIITTRDKHILFGVDHEYRMNVMNKNESLELFSWHAFRETSPREDFVVLSNDVVDYSGGLPLALEVIGSYLFDRGIIEWKSVLEKLKKIPNHEVHKKLKISFDGLSDDTEKEIFLDIACFFIGMDRNDVIQILNGCGLFAEIGISILVERSLISVDNNKLVMHDLLREMGREIIREKSPKRPEKRSRLWTQEEVIDVLSNHTGTNTVEGLTLQMRDRTISLQTEAFNEMKQLRFLQLSGVQLDGDLKYLSKNLRWLCWHKFPLTHIPTSLYQGGLVAMELEYSKLQLVWEKAQLLEKLKILNLSHSYDLVQTPDFSKLPNLEKLILKDCQSLYKISRTIQNLQKLLEINLENCINLCNLPRSLYKLKSLKTLILSRCSRIDKLEEDLEQMESLTTLIADETAITKVPYAIVRKNIGHISLCGFEGFSHEVFPSIIWSWMSPTNHFLPLLQTSVVSSSLVFIEIPNKSSQVLSSILEGLKLTGDVENSALIDCCCQSYVSGSKNLLKSLLIQMGMKCQVTNFLKEIILQEPLTSGSGVCLLPSDNWRTFNGEGSSVSFEVPLMNGRNLQTMMLCIVYYSSSDMTTSGLKSVLVINDTKDTIQVFRRDVLTSFKEKEWQSVISNLEAGNKVKVCVIFGYGFHVKKTAVYLIYDKLVDEKLEHCQSPEIIDSDGDENCRTPHQSGSILNRQRRKEEVEEDAEGSPRKISNTIANVSLRKFKSQPPRSPTDPKTSKKPVPISTSLEPTSSQSSRQPFVEDSWEKDKVIRDELERDLVKGKAPLNFKVSGQEGLDEEKVVSVELENLLLASSESTSIFVEIGTKHTSIVTEVGEGILEPDHADVDIEASFDIEANVPTPNISNQTTGVKTLGSSSELVSRVEVSKLDASAAVLTSGWEVL